MTSPTEIKTATLGVKLYTSFRDLELNLDVACCQRQLIPEHVDKIRKFVREEVINSHQPPRIGVIDVAKLGDKYYVVDGQHRLQAIREESQGGVSISFFLVFYPVDSIGEIAELFQIKNRNIPVPEYLMQPDKRNKQALLKQIEAFLRGKKLFKNSCQKRPAINVGEFMNKLNKSQLLTKIQSLEQFQEAYDKINNYYYQQCQNAAWTHRQKISQNMLDKCQDDGTYLGLESNWLWMDNLSWMDSPNYAQPPPIPAMIPLANYGSNPKIITPTLSMPVQPTIPVRTKFSMPPQPSFLAQPNFQTYGSTSTIGYGGFYPESQQPINYPTPVHSYPNYSTPMQPVNFNYPPPVQSHLDYPPPAQSYINNFIPTGYSNNITHSA